MSVSVRDRGQEYLPPAKALSATRVRARARACVSCGGNTATDRRSVSSSSSRVLETSKRQVDRWGFGTGRKVCTHDGAGVWGAGLHGILETASPFRSPGHTHPRPAVVRRLLPASLQAGHLRRPQRRRLAFVRTRLLHRIPRECWAPPAAHRMLHAAVRMKTGHPSPEVW